MDIVWHKVFGSLQEAENSIPFNGSMLFTLGNVEFCIFRTKTGLWAIENRCPHQDYPLHGSTCDKYDMVICSFHFLPVHLRTGVTGNVNYKPVKTYPVQIRNDGVYVEI